MDNDYLSAVWSSLNEQDVHRLLTEALSNLGWKVKNLHDSERRFEEGADLIASRNGDTWLIAVKMRPSKKDLKQLQTLSRRRSEGQLKYFYVRNPTEPFRKEMHNFAKNTDFGDMSVLHSLLVEGESVEYLVHVLGNHCLLHQMAEVLALLWEHRHTKRQTIPLTAEELKCLWSLKDACLKLRTSLCFASIRWDDEIMQKTEVRKEDFGMLLDRAINDLSAAHRFVGSGLETAFKTAHRIHPQLLGLYWSLVRERTYWEDFAYAAEDQKTRDDVVHLAQRFWLVPNRFVGFRSQRIRETMSGFYSSLIGLFRNLANVATELERGVDWTLQEIGFGVENLN